jgi:hypothetical protein
MDTRRSGSGSTNSDCEMAKKIRYQPEFDFDVQAAADWYDERQTEPISVIIF